jgi:hypothetical protein
VRRILGIGYLGRDVDAVRDDVHVSGAEPSRRLSEEGRRGNDASCPADQGLTRRGTLAASSTSVPQT